MHFGPQVQKSDYLPLKICSPCANTLLTFHQLYLVCQTTNARFQEMLSCYEQPKQMDASELLELQSSISREIENEIMYMNESKDINEIESEIAANAAVKELERIGSTENISLVGEIIDQLDDLESAGKKNAEEIEPKNKASQGHSESRSQSLSDVPAENPTSANVTRDATNAPKASKGRNGTQKASRAAIPNGNGRIPVKAVKKEKVICAFDGNGL